MRILLLALALLVAGCTTETSRGPTDGSIPPVPPPGEDETQPVQPPASPPAPPPTQPTPPPGGGEVGFTAMEGCESTRAEELYEVVNDEARWRELWAESCQSTLDAPGAPNGTAPAVDFGTQSVVAAFWGQKNTAGYAVEILRIADSARGATVEVDRASPGATCATAQVLTYPAALVRTDTKLAQAEFAFQDRVHEC